MSNVPYTHFADLVGLKGERIRFHWTDLADSVLMIHLDAAGETVDTETPTKLEARASWAWFINAGWSQYANPQLGNPANAVVALTT